MKNKILTFLCYILIATFTPVMADELEDLKKRLEEAEATVAFFAENLVNCSEELAACEQKKLVKTEIKEELILQLRELLETNEDLSYLYKLSDSELEKFISTILRSKDQKRN